MENRSISCKRTIEAERSFSQHNEPLDLDYSIQELSTQSYGPDEIQNFYEKLVVKRVDRKLNKNNFGFPIRNSNLVSSSTQRIASSRNCSDPDNEVEVSVVVTEGNWPEEITWFLNDSISGETVLSGGAPFDTALCLPVGYYNLVALDSYGDGWNDSI